MSRNLATYPSNPGATSIESGRRHQYLRALDSLKCSPRSVSIQFADDVPEVLVGVVYTAYDLASVSSRVRR